MRLSKIKTKEIRYVVWKYRLKRFLPHILTLCLAVIVAGGAFSAYSVYHKKHQKQLAKQSEVQREKDVNTARKKAQKEKTTLKPWYTYHSIAHAMGGLDGKDYLNSIDGFYPAYQKGYRVFEMDILLTKDNVAIGKHQWGRKLSDPTSKKGDPVSYRKFKNTKIYGKYTPTSFLDVLNLMEKYPDFYLMTDSKSTEPADAKKEFNVLVQTAKKVGKEDLLDRVIVQVYNQRMYWAVKSVHPFKHFVYTTYKQPDAAFYKVVKFCKQNGIEAITSPKNDINDYRMELLAKQGIYSYTHSVNNAYFAKEFMKLGVYGVYSDFLSPAQVNNSYIRANCPKFASRYVKTIQTTTQCVCYMISVNNFCIYQLLRKSDFGLIPMNFQSHTHQIMVM